MKNKVTFYLKSGNVFSARFKSLTIDKLSSSKGQRELKYDGASKKFTIDVDEIECVHFHKNILNILGIE